MTELRQIQCRVLVDRPFADVRAALHRLMTPDGGPVRVTSLCDQDHVAGLPALTRATLHCDAAPFSSVEVFVRGADVGTEVELDGHWWPDAHRKFAPERAAVDEFLRTVVEALRQEADARSGAGTSGRSKSGS